MNGEALGQNIAERLVSTSHLSGKLKLGICSISSIWSTCAKVSGHHFYYIPGELWQQLATNPRIEAKFHGSAGDLLNGETLYLDE